MSGKLYDKTDPAFWRAIKPETTLTLTDEQALRECLDGQNYLVKEVIKIREMDDACEWLFFRVEGLDGAPDSWLMVKIAGEELDVRVYFEDESFESGNRNDMIENETLWLFCPPDDPEDFTCEELQYAKHIGWDFPGDEDGDPDIHVDYNVKLGELQGRVAYDPYQSEQSEHVATVVEFDTSDETTCPEMLLLEIGHAENDEGGLIRMMFGNNIRPTEVEVLAVTKA
ncbi:MAG: hypothetical protein ACXAC5_01570 [Promethearchaeota archaeon]|jgi:hypothetical protein